MCRSEWASQNLENVSVSSLNYCQGLKYWCSTFICHNMAQVCWSISEKKASQRVQKRKKERQAGPAAGAVSKPAQALKDEIHFVSSCVPSLPDEGSRGEEGERVRWRVREGEIEREICLICQKFFNLIYSCQDADDPDLITAFYLPDFTPGTRHSFPARTHTHTDTRTHS